MNKQRRRIRVHGIVQGVGFRPFVYGLALRYHLDGFVLNDSDGVLIEVEGSTAQLAAFEQGLRTEPPPLARIDAIESQSIMPLQTTVFAIIASDTLAQRNTLIAPDTATCDDCLRELFDPDNRRYRYPFINCTNCGPRFTIVEDVPYDHTQTTMRQFALCPACRAEYDDPLNRRFHAQPNACSVCGPSVVWKTRHEQDKQIEREAALAAAVAGLVAGQVLAVKGLGGYHLACNALNGEAVQCLRGRKQREGKPFALMVPDVATARRLCHLDADEAALLASHRRPIVLLAVRNDAAVPSAVAPRQRTLGLMLPYTPLHHLLLHDFAATVGTDRPTALVMTSGNSSDEPIVYRDDDAARRLQSIADGFLVHNRPIHMRCDDSVACMVTGKSQLLRRSRGYAPEPLLVAMSFPLPILACGGHLKNTFCLARDRQVFISHHIGDLENLETLGSFREGIAHFKRLFDIVPKAFAYDLHPEYLATKVALALDVPHKIGVQHHHAHIASVLAEHGLSGPVIGIAADGTGYGTDGTIWGGEVFIADLAEFERVAHLGTVPLPGGEQAVRQPWRVAAAYLAQVYGPAFLDLDLPFVKRIDRGRWRTLSQMIERGVNSPRTSSMGRLFDAVAALVGVRDEVSYEGQAAIELEALTTPSDVAYPFAIVPSAPRQIDMHPAIRAIVADLQRGAAMPVIAGRFHRTIAEALLAVCREVRAATALDVVALSGGVFQNRLLLSQLTALLRSDGFAVYTNRRVPPNDGGLCLGQAAVAAARLAQAG